MRREWPSQSALQKLNKGMLVKKLKVFMFVAALSMSANAVQADELKVNVVFADLNLARTEGAASLYGRINSAARTVCAPLDGRRLEEKSLFRTCVGDAGARAVSDVNKPTLTKYYESKVGAHDHGAVAVASR